MDPRLHPEAVLNLVMPVIGDLEHFAIAANGGKYPRRLLKLSCEIAVRALMLARRHNIALDIDGVWRAR